MNRLEVIVDEGFNEYKVINELLKNRDELSGETLVFLNQEEGLWLWDERVPELPEWSGSRISELLEKAYHDYESAQASTVDNASIGLANLAMLGSCFLGPAFASPEVSGASIIGLGSISILNTFRLGYRVYRANKRLEEFAGELPGFYYGFKNKEVGKEDLKQVLESSPEEFTSLSDRVRFVTGSEH